RAKAVTAVLDAAKSEGLRALLAAHFATVATFVPTDVDARIRHHVWSAMQTAEEIAAACDVVDEVASWDARWVSARTVDDGERSLSGHDGEWLGVRAGALGRASALGASELVERLVENIDSELAREERMFVNAWKEGAPAARTLSIATIIAHNLGD